ncbi:MAG: hypothetical protein ACI865_000960 [Flavobacteriaceae bacterium]|jgi:hypothetical protein
MIRVLLVLLLLLGNAAHAQDSLAIVTDAVDSSTIDTSEEPTILPIKTIKGWQLMNPRLATIDASRIFSEFQWPTSGVTDYFILKKDNYWGAIDMWDYELLPFIYDTIIDNKGNWLAKKDSIWEYHLPGETLLIKADSIFLDDQLLYYFYNGKTGLFKEADHISSPKYDLIHPFKCANHLSSQKPYYLVKDGGFFNLHKDSSLCLPSGVIDVRCNDFEVFEFYRSSKVEYFFSSTGEILTPDGREVVIYNDSEYKIYDERGKMAAYHQIDGKVLEGIYEDYFPLTNRHLAVRRDGKIALYDQLSDRLLTPFKYDQITQIDQNYQGEKIHFKFFIGNDCGAMDANGRELFEPHYANIMFSGSSKFFRVIKNERTGVIKRNGEVVIPISYDYIVYYPLTNFFVVQDNQKYGIFKATGEELIPINYHKHRFEIDNSSANQTAVHVLGNGKDMFFVGQMGMLDGKPYTHYEITSDVIKAYGADAITVFLLDRDGNVEEKETYRGIKSVVVSKNFKPMIENYAGWPTSYLEENQLTGKFGLRWFEKAGIAVNPNYRQIRKTYFSRLLGEVPYKTSSAPFLKEFDINVVRSFNELGPSSGTIINYKTYNTELLQVSESNTYELIHHKTDRSQTIDHSGNNELIPAKYLETNRVHYSDILQHSLKRYYIGGEAVLCDIDTADVSLFDYYMYWNLTSACRLPGDKMSLVLNPKLGVKFVDATQKVFELSTNLERKGTVRYDKISDYTDFQTFYGDFIFELRGKHGRLLKYRYDEKRGAISIGQIENPELVYTEGGAAVVAVIEEKVRGKIHKEYPTYNFIQSENSFAYHSGRIIKSVDSVYTRLVTPEDEIIRDSALRITYLGEGFFGIYDSLGVQVIHRSGRKLRPEHYISVMEFSHGRIQVRDSSGYSHIVDTTGKILKSSLDSFKSLDERKYIDESNKSIIYDRLTSEVDTLKEGERYYGHGFITKKVNGVYSIRTFGAQKSIDVDLPGRLQYFRHRLYYQLKKHFYTIDSSLVIEQFKKASKFQTIAPNVGWLEGKKLNFLIDTNWNILYSLNSNESFKMVEDRPMIRTGGRLIPLFKAKKDSVEIVELNKARVQIFEKDGRYGLQLENRVLQSAIYESISPINVDEFHTVLPMTKKVFSSELTSLFEFPFDTFVQTYDGDVLVRYNGEVMAYDRDGNRIY